MLWHQWHLVQQTVALCRSHKTRHCRLVRDLGKKQVQMILKEIKVTTVLIPQASWEKVEQSRSMHKQGLFPSFSDITAGVSGHIHWDSVSSSPLAELPLH